MAKNALLVFLLGTLISHIFFVVASANETKAIRMATEEEISSMFILDKIGNFIQRNRSTHPVEVCDYGISYRTTFSVPAIIGQMGRSRLIYYNRNYLDKYMEMVYDYVLNTNNSKSPTITISILKYRKPTDIRNDVINKYMSLWRKIYKVKTKKKSELKIEKIINNKILVVRSPKDSNIRSVIWISNDTIIKISYMRYIKFNEDKSLLTAYLDKYPATWEISMSDFDPEKVLRNEVDRYLRIIQEQEENRESDDKITVYRAMNYQCEFEAEIRCWTGETTKGCPITMEMDREKRRQQWEEFSAKARSRPVNTEKYHSLEMFVPECQDHKAYLKIADKIGLSYENIPPEYTMYRRE